jgi:hypothetical protein
MYITEEVRGNATRLCHIVRENQQLSKTIHYQHKVT